MKKCPKCGEKMNCGAEEPMSECWCSSFPPILPIDRSKACVCQSCLKKQIQVAIDLYVQEYKAGKRENIAPMLPSQQMIEGIDYYTEKGFRVMTEWYHLKRGYCCRNGCRHCPYGFKKSME